MSDERAPAPLEPGDAYVENGFLVFTAQYHRRRGFCCGNRCRHCPYAHVNVPFPGALEVDRSE